MNLTKILDIVFSPATILKKFFDVDGSYFLAAIGVVIWAICVFLGAVLVGTTAGPLFQIFVWVIGYLSSLYFHANLHTTDDDLLLVVLLAIAAILGGLMVGISLHALSLLYFL